MPGKASRRAGIAGAVRQRDHAVVQSVEFDKDLHVGHRARERHEDVADEARLADVRVLVAHDAGVIGRRRSHRERRDDGGTQRLETEILQEVLRLAVGAGRERACEIAVERVADQVGHAGARPRSCSRPRLRTGRSASPSGEGRRSSA